MYPLHKLMVYEQARELASAKETECHLQMARDAGLLAPEQHALLKSKVDNLAPRLVRLLHAVRRNAKRRIKESP